MRIHTCERCKKEFKPTECAQWFNRIIIERCRDYPEAEQKINIFDLCPRCMANLKRWFRYAPKGWDKSVIYPVSHGPNDCGCSEEVLKK